MFNRLKQEITMKKYIAPVAKAIDIELEENILLNGSGTDTVALEGEEASNERERFSIWGNEELY